MCILTLMKCIKMGTPPTNMKLGFHIKANYEIQKQSLSKVKNMFQLLGLNDLDI